MSEIKEKAKKAFDIFRENTGKDSIRLIPGSQKMDDEANTKTKIGGIPYWPEDEAWPVIKTTIDRNGNTQDTPAICYAQLNFDELPNLPGYPSTGLLQFFIGQEIDFYNKGNCKVIYRKDLSKSMLKEVPRSTLKDEYSSDDILSVEGVYYPTSKLEKQAMTCADNNYDTELCKAINSVFGTSYKLWAEVPKDIDRAFYDITKEDDPFGCRIGGHPYFTQSDVRDEHYSELLLQLDSESNMMWGDCGVANFFMSKADLNSLNFNDVYFTWDCC